MAILRVKSGTVGGTGDGSSEANAFLHVQLALTARLAGDEIWIDPAHSELDEIGEVNAYYTCATATAIDPCILKSVNLSTDVYTPVIIGQFDVITRSPNFQFPVWFEGVNVEGANLGFEGGFTCLQEISDARLRAISSFFRFRSRDKIVDMKNTEIVLSAGGYLILDGVKLRMQGGKFTGTHNAPNGLFQPVSANAGGAEFDGTDFSGFTFQDDYLKTTWSGFPFKVKFINCKGDFLAIDKVFPVANMAKGAKAEFINSNPAELSGEYACAYSEGSTIETDRAIYNDSVSGQFATGTKMSRKVLPSAEVSMNFPVECEEIFGVVETTGSKTFEIEVAHDFTDALKIGEIYFEIQFLGTASENLHTLTSTANVSGTNAINHIDAGVDTATSVSAWTGAAGLTRQKISKTLTINRAGYFKVVPYLAKYEAGKKLHYTPEVFVS